LKVCSFILTLALVAHSQCLGRCLGEWFMPAEAPCHQSDATPHGESENAPEACSGIATPGKVSVLPDNGLSSALPPSLPATMVTRPDGPRESLTHPRLREIPLKTSSILRI
jgi:hypothetical protein